MSVAVALLCPGVLLLSRPTYPSRAGGRSERCGGGSGGGGGGGGGAAETTHGPGLPGGGGASAAAKTSGLGHDDEKPTAPLANGTAGNSEEGEKAKRAQLRFTAFI